MQEQQRQMYMTDGKKREASKADAAPVLSQSTQRTNERRKEREEKMVMSVCM